MKDIFTTNFSVNPLSFKCYDLKLMSLIQFFGCPIISKRQCLHTFLFFHSLLYFQETLNRQEEERANTEKQRMRRLMVQGIVKPEDIEDSALYKERRSSKSSNRLSSRVTERTPVNKRRRVYNHSLL